MNGAYQNVLKIFKRQRNFYADGEMCLYTGLSVHVILYCRYIQPSFFYCCIFYSLAFEISVSDASESTDHKGPLKYFYP